MKVCLSDLVKDSQHRPKAMGRKRGEIKDRCMDLLVVASKLCRTRESYFGHGMTLSDLG